MKKRLYVLVIIASVLVNVAQPKERFVKAKDEIIMILLKSQEFIMMIIMRLFYI